MSSFPLELVEEFARGNGSVFVGAGLSMGAGMPSWAKLVKPLANEITDCPEDISYLDIAQFYANEHGRGLLVRRLVKVLASYKFAPTAVHQTLVGLPVRRIFTTNFDDIIEIALREQKILFHKVVKTQNLVLQDASIKQLIKLHGDLEQPDSIVIAKDDYNNYFDKNSALADAIKAELQTQTVLFMGYSFNDQDLQMIMSRVSRESADLKRNLFTVQSNPSKAVITDLEMRGIRVIPLQRKEGADGVDGVTAALQEWLEEFAKLVQQEKDKIAAANPDDPTRSAAASLTVINHNLERATGDLLGRKEDFNRVMEALRSRYPLITIEGFGGVGKTSLALEVGYACSSVSRANTISDAVTFDYVVWISARHKPEQKHWFDDVLNIIAVTTKNSVIAQQPASKIEEKKLQVNGIMQRYKVLLIVDNYETIDDPDLTVWLGEVPDPSKVIIVTRNRRLDQKAYAVDLRGLKREEALTLLRQHARAIGLDQLISQTNDETLGRLSEVTGGNPQALKLALGLVKGGGGNLNGVINLLAGANVDALFEAIFSRSWGALSEDGQRILLVTPLFVGVSSIRRDALQAATGLDNYDFNKSLNECIGFGLLEVDQNVGDEHIRFVIHPLTRAFARKQLDEQSGVESEARHRCSDYFLELLKDNILRSEPNRRYWNALVSDGMNAIDPEWPSIQETMKWADDQGQDEVLVELVMRLVHYMDSRFYNNERLFYVQKAVAALEKMGRKEDEALLRIDALGWTYVEEDRLAEGYDEILRGFHIAEQFAVEERDDLRALSLAWRARVRIEQDISSEEAKTLIKEALEIKNCSPWIEARVCMSAGDIEFKKGNMEEALAFYQRAEKETDKYGREGHNYQIGPRIGFALVGVGNFDEAEKEFKTLLQHDRIAIGQLYAEYGLAVVAYKNGETLDARRLIEATRAKISRRTQTNLLLKLINELYEDMELGHKE